MYHRSYPIVIVKCILLLAVTTFLFGYDNQPVFTQRTGAFGEPTCVECHNSFGLNSGGGSLTFQSVPAQYTPGATYTITIQFSHPNRTTASKWGFEAAVRFQNGGAQAGQITASNDTLLRTTNGIQYLSHLPNNPNSVRRGNLGPVTWTFTWQAPAQANGPIVFAVAGNAANGDGSSAGDYIYTATATSNPGGGGGIQFPNYLYFAQFANGNGLASMVTLTNPGSSPVTVGLSMYSDDGSPFNLNLAGDPPVADITNFTIPPLGTQTLTTDGQGALMSGWLKVGYSSTLSGVVLFSAPGLGSTGVGDGRSLTGAITPVFRNTGTGLNTGVAVINIGSSTATVTLTLHRPDGTAAGAPVTKTVAVNGHFALFLDALFPGVDTSNFKGSLEIRGGGNSIVAMALRIGGGEFTTLPVASLP